MKKLFFLIIFTNLLISIFSQSDDQTDNNKSELYPGLILKIEHANPKIFYQNDEIYINIKLFNTSDKDTFCLIAEDKKFSFDFHIVTMQNRQIEHSSEYINSYHRVQAIFKSHIRIAPGEGYIFKARLNDYYDLNISGQYFINCFYFPELRLSNSMENALGSNQLSLNIRPSKIQDKSIEENEAIEKEKKDLKLEKKSPDEIIDYVLKARQKKEWEKFFLYIDLENLILTNNEFKQRFLRTDIEKKKEIISEYKEYLKQDKIDGISFIPTDFEILRTEYSKGRAKVEVLEYFIYQKYEEKKYYTYYLYLKDNIWFVTSYEVLNFK